MHSVKVISNLQKSCQKLPTHDLCTHEGKSLNKFPTPHQPHNNKNGVDEEHKIYLQNETKLIAV